MHRVSEIAKLAQLYSGSSDEEKEEALKITGNSEIMRTVRNLGKATKGRDGLKRTGRSKNIAATTKDMRDIAREAHRRGLNRQMRPAQFKLLDPRGTHIISPTFFHEKADGKVVEMHVRCHVHLKLLGKQAAIENLIDIPMQFLEDHLTGQEKLELMDAGLAHGAIEDTAGKS
jgi:hypothetical protein